MARSADDVLNEIDELLSRAGLAPGQPLVAGQYGAIPGKTDGEVAGLNTAWVAAIERLTPVDSPYRERAHTEINRVGTFSGYALVAIAGLLNGLRRDYERGYLSSVAELIHAEVFADFLEMAAELLGKGYKDPAGVLTGSVLEEHLRKLSEKHGVDTETPTGAPVKAERMNADLKKAGAYNGLVQKQVTEWLDLRNKAAHGKYKEYTDSQVALMLEGVRSFLIAHPA